MIRQGFAISLDVTHEKGDWKMVATIPNLSYLTFTFEQYIVDLYGGLNVIVDKMSVKTVMNELGR